MKNYLFCFFTTLIIIISILTYIDSFKIPFLWDDFELIVNNRFIKNISNIKLLTSKNYYSLSKEEGGYRPIVTLSFFFDYYFWKLNPKGYHITNLVLHILCSIMTFFTIYKLIDWNNNKRNRINSNFNSAGEQHILNLLFSFIGAILFSVYPVNTEAVCGISFREDLICTLFFLLSFILFLKIFENQLIILNKNPNSCPNKSFYQKTFNKNWVLYIISNFFLVISLFSKEIAVTFPVICYFFILIFSPSIRENIANKKFKGGKFLTFFYKINPFSKKNKLLIGYLITTIFYLLIRFYFLKNPFQQFIYHGSSIYTNLLTVCKSIASYLKILFFPFRLCADYSPPISKSILEISVLSSLLLILLLFALLFITFKKNKTVSFSIIWFLLTLFPVSNIIPISIIMAERYIYISSFGFFLFIAYIFKLALERNKFIFLFLFFFLFTFYYSKTIKRINIWTSEIGFWEDTSSCSSRAGRVWANLGYAYLKNNMLSEAENALLKSLEKINNQIHNGEIDRYGVTYRSINNLGIVYSMQGNIDKGISYFKNAIEINPTYAKAHFNLAVSLEKKGRLNEAKKEYLIGLKYEPENLEAKANLSRINSLIRNKKNN